MPRRDATSQRFTIYERCRKAIKYDKVVIWREIFSAIREESEDWGSNARVSQVYVKDDFFYVILFITCFPV